MTMTFASVMEGRGKNENHWLNDTNSVSFHTHLTFSPSSLESFGFTVLSQILGPTKIFPNGSSFSSLDLGYNVSHFSLLLFPSSCSLKFVVIYLIPSLDYEVH